jgi:hypothetical protein
MLGSKLRRASEWRPVGIDSETQSRSLDITDGVEYHRHESALGLSVLRTSGPKARSSRNRDSRD